MCVYGLSYRDALALPLTTFWMLSNNSGRLMAERDLRTLRVASSAQSGDAVKTLTTSLQREIGDVFVSKTQEGLKRLRLLFSRNAASARKSEDGRGN